MGGKTAFVVSKLGSKCNRGGSMKQKGCEKWGDFTSYANKEKGPIVDEFLRAEELCGISFWRGRGRCVPRDKER